MEGEEKNYTNNGDFFQAANGLSDTPDNQAPVGDFDWVKHRRKEKISSIAIISIGLVALFFGLVAFWFNLSNPFSTIIAKGEASRKKLAEQQKLELLALQTRDTDQDGLVDYLETDKYKTSPYLADSDSDGLTDREEIDRSSDPNCPEGQTCYAEITEETTEDAAASTQQTGISSDLTITPQSIRNLMAQTDMTDEEIAAFSDQEILTEFAAYLDENPEMKQQLVTAGYDLSALGISASTAATATADTSNLATSTLASGPVSTSTVDLSSLSSVEDLNKLSGAQIRQLMINAGADQNLLSSVSDDQLKEMFIKQMTTKLSNQ
jgi:hypothetical protein